MKKGLFIILLSLITHYSFSQQVDTLIVFPSAGNSTDTITFTYILPEIMNENVCYDNGHYDNLMYIPQGFEVSRLACDNQSLKSVAQGFMLYDTTPVEGFYALIGTTTGYIPFSPAEFKIGVMDASFNVIYEKEYVFDLAEGYSPYGEWVSFIYLPFDSILNLNDFIYAYFEWPDSACVGGYFVAGLYGDNETRMNLHAFTEQRVPPNMLTDNECMACAVKYEPLFKWYGETSWTNLSSLRCDLSDWYAYGFEKEDDLITTLYSPPIGVSLYYTNNNNGDNGGDDNGENNDNGNNNDDNNEGGGESGLTDIDVSHLVSISPNPADDILKIQSSFKVKEIEIHNALGQVVLRKEGSQNIETIDVSNLQSGTYIVRIKTQRGFANKKIVIR